MSEPLVSPNTKVKASSLPLSLRPLSADDAIYNAREIAAFLQTAYAGIGESDSELSSEAARGGELCFDLLLDYLDIASGSYAFPFVGYYDSPELCTRKE